MDPTVLNMISFSCRSSLEDEKVRESIILQKLEELGEKMITTDNMVASDGTIYVIGKTFIPMRKKELAYIEKYLETMTDPNTVYAFTSSNLPDKKTSETHFQSFVVDNIHKRLYIADPSRKPGGKEGIYASYISDGLVSPYFVNKKYEPKYVLAKDTLQKASYDVYCQTWSLILQIEKLKNIIKGQPDKLIDIPSKKEDKYLYLVDFYKTLYNNTEFCKKLNSEFEPQTNYASENSPEDRELFENAKKFMENKNACDFLSYLDVSNLDVV